MRSKSSWVLGAILYTQDDNRRTLQRHIKITDGRIEEITSRRPKKFAPETKLIDATGLIVLPGFVQAHVHLCQTLFRNQADDLELLDWLSKKIWIMESAHTEETLYTSAILGIYELLSSGTTCILDMGTVRHTHSIFEAIRETGIRANIGKCLMDHPTRNPKYLQESTQSALSEATSLYSQWNGSENDRIRVSYAPRFAISCTENLLSKVAHLSREQNALIHTHASENQTEIRWVKEFSKLENIEYLSGLGLTSPRLVLAHCIWLNSVEKDILSKTGTNVVHCPSSNLKLASGIAPIPALKACGINVGLGADGTPCNNNLNMFQEMRLAALIHKPNGGPQTMRAMDVLDMATRNGAKALNWFDQIGSIEIGKKADIIALDLSTLTNSIPKSDLLNSEAIASSIVYSSQPNHLRWTMVDGKMVYKNGKVVTISEKNLLHTMQKAQRKLFARSQKLL